MPLSATEILFSPVKILINYQDAVQSEDASPREDHTSCYCISLCLPAWEYSPPITASNEFLPMSYYLQNLSHSPGVPGLWVIISSSLTYQWLREISYCNFQHRMKHPSRSQSWRNLLWEEWFQVIHHYEMKMQKPLKSPKMIQINPCCKAHDQWGVIFSSTQSNKY